VAAAATAWRVTSGGRALRDRAASARALRRAPAVAAYLLDECGLPPGPGGVGAALAAAPHALLCRPARHDRWDRRFIQLAAFAARPGHVDVPEDVEGEAGAEAADADPSAGLAAWCLRQRVSWSAGALAADRAAALAHTGFDFGDMPQLTDAWEAAFDGIVDALLALRGTTPAAALAPAPGRPAATALAAAGEPELGVWVALQRAFRARGLLPAGAAARLDAVGFGWAPHGPPERRARAAAVGTPSDGDAAWEAGLGALVLAAERARARRAPGAPLAAAPPGSDALPQPCRAWLLRQTAAWLGGRLPPPRVALLRSAGWAPDALASPPGWRADALAAARAAAAAEGGRGGGCAPPRARRWARAVAALAADARAPPPAVAELLAETPALGWLAAPDGPARHPRAAAALLGVGPAVGVVERPAWRRAPRAAQPAPALAQGASVGGIWGV